MGVSNFDDLRIHRGHTIKVVTYGNPDPRNVAIECISCSEVLVSFDKEWKDKFCYFCNVAESDCSSDFEPMTADETNNVKYEGQLICSSCYGLGRQNQ